MIFFLLLRFFCCFCRWSHHWLEVMEPLSAVTFESSANLNLRFRFATGEHVEVAWLELEDPRGFIEGTTRWFPEAELTASVWMGALGGSRVTGDAGRLILGLLSF